MAYDQIDLAKDSSLNTALPLPNNTFETLNYTAVDNEFSKESIPLYLVNLSSSLPWKVIHIEDIILEKIPKDSEHLYLDELILRKHNPNHLFEKVREVLLPNHLFAFKIITSENIKFELQNRILPRLIPFYYPAHFFARRVLPKLKGFRKISRILNLPVDVSKAEIMGRLIYKGFHIVSLRETNEETIIVAKINTDNNPSLSKPEPSEGILFKMGRMGKNAEKITVYKFRSMHPYAEYVQEYIHTNNGLDAGGKFKNDFRVSPGGRVIRKYWIDELPMVINLLKGDIKLIGVRPITEHYFSLYPPHLQSLRIKNKPGLLPPFYADLPKTFDEIVQSELNYLEAYEKAPFQTDSKYLIKILKNIFIHKVRSK